MMSSTMKSYFLKFLEQEEYMEVEHIDRGLNPLLYPDTYTQTDEEKSRDLYRKYLTWEVGFSDESIARLDNFSLLNFIQLIYLSETDPIESSPNPISENQS